DRVIAVRVEQPIAAGTVGNPYRFDPAAALLRICLVPDGNVIPDALGHINHTGGLQIGRARVLAERGSSFGFGDDEFPGVPPRREMAVSGLGVVERKDAIYDGAQPMLRDRAVHHFETSATADEQRRPARGAVMTVRADITDFSCE